MAQLKYSANQLRTVNFDNSSNWLVSFSKSGKNGARIENLNLINSNFVPAIDVEYTQASVNKSSIDLGPGVSYEYITHQNPTRSITLTVYDDDDRTIRNEIIRWIDNITSRDSNSLRVPNMADIKNYATVINIHRLKGGNVVGKPEKFSVVPDGDISFRGDQDFTATTISLTFNVLGEG